MRLATPIAFLILVGSGAIFYIYLNRASPNFVEIIIGTTVIGLFIGIASSLIHTLFDKHLKEKPLISVFIILCCIIILIAVLIYASNIPKGIKRQILVTYFINEETGGLYIPPQKFNTLTAKDIFPSMSMQYFAANAILHEYFRSHPKEKNLLSSGTVEDRIKLQLTISRDFVPYLVPVLMSMPDKFDNELSAISSVYNLYKTKKRFQELKLEKIKLNDIKGNLDSNIFYEMTYYKNFDCDHFKVPVGTTVLFERLDNRIFDLFILKHKYFNIKIQIWHDFAPWSDQPLNPVFDDSGKWKWLVLHTNIHIEAKFSRFLYGSPKMNLYKDYVNYFIDEFANRFKWGEEYLKFFEDKTSINSLQLLDIKNRLSTLESKIR